MSGLPEGYENKSLGIEYDTEDLLYQHESEGGTDPITDEVADPDDPSYCEPYPFAVAPKVVDL